jgi:peptide chain release factor 2
LGRERSRLETIVSTLDMLENSLADAKEMLELAIDEQD